MDLRDYAQVLHRRWRFIAACAFLGLCVAGLVTWLMPRTYTARAQLFVATSDKDSSNAYQGALFTQQRVKSYTQIVNSPALLGQVVSELGLRMTPDQLAVHVSATVPLDSVLVDIRVNDKSPKQAQRIADATAVQFTKFVAGIEQPSAGGAPLVKVSVVGPSQLPKSPTSPHVALNLAIGLLAGLVVGVTGAGVRESLDTTMRTAHDVSRHTGLTTLGVLPVERGRGRPPVLPDAGPAGSTEAVAQLRTNLRFGSGGQMPRSLVITSAEWDEGKTATALDLMVSLGRAGQRVVLVEADLRKPWLAAHLGLDSATGLSSVLEGEATLADALQDYEGPLTRILPGGPPAPNPSELLGSSAMARVLRALEEDADVVLLNGPPLLAFTDSAVLAAEAGGALLVVRAGQTPRDKVRSALDKLAAVRATVLGIVLTTPPTMSPAGRRRHDATASPTP
ncbi:polysaccharide biosynthesis tyrosine autokinase [Streptomyces sp. NPDC050145]|uniref:polysaccharide biosynthesis tyrosine autokinase n=1 Tax=Streptomyces sp. NPDC050145 TaxID=3365602 RepID=UPI0037B452E4